MVNLHENKNFVVGQKVINDDSNHWYKGKECKINAITFFPAGTGFNKDHLTVYTLSFGNVSFAVTKILPVE